MYAHVVFPLNGWGDQSSVRFEFYVNGAVYSAMDRYQYEGISQLEIDVPEYSSVRVDAVVIDGNGMANYSSSDTIDVGAAPQPEPDPNPQPPPQLPSFGSPYVAYWAN